MPSASASPSSTSCAAGVGRGSAKSSCLLLYAQPLGETAKARLAIMRENEDGYRIARKT
jgi:ATP-dependent DNA helicase RecG